MVKIKCDRCGKFNKSAYRLIINGFHNNKIVYQDHKYDTENIVLLCSKCYENFNKLLDDFISEEKTEKICLNCYNYDPYYMHCNLNGKDICFHDTCSDFKEE